MARTFLKLTWRTLTPVLLTCLVLGGGCSAMRKPLAGNILRIPMQTNPAFIDPARAQDDYSTMIGLQVFEGLVQRAQDGQIVPCLADKWDVLDGGNTYIFHLHKGVTFSNGDPVTADDFKYSIERAANPEIKSPMVETYLDDIVGVSDKMHGKAKEVAGVTVIDPMTLKITIDKPRPYFLGKLAFPVSSVVDKKVTPPDKVALEPAQWIGTGPFVIKKYTEDQVVLLDANPNYWGEKPKIAGIEMPILKDAITRLNKFKAGELDIIQLQTKDVAALKADPKYSDEVHPYSRAGVDYVAMNGHVYPPFAKAGVRRAVMMAVDRVSLVNQVLSGVSKVATGILPDEVLGSRSKTAILPYDPAAAKRELASAGYADGSDLPAVDLYYESNNEDAKLVAQSVQDDLKKNLGMVVNVKPLEFGTFLDKINKKQLGFYTLSWLADYIDPQNFLSTLLTTTGPENRSYYSNAEVDRLCAEADQLPQKDPKRLDDYAKAEDLILQDAAWVPIYFFNEPWLVSTRAKGARHAVYGWMPHNQVTLQGQ